MAKDYKPRYKSKTYWFGALLIALPGILQSEHVAPLIDLLPGEWSTYAYSIIGVIVIILREVTKKPVGRAG
jgi:hypothetical protein